MRLASILAFILFASATATFAAPVSFDSALDEILRRSTGVAAQEARVAQIRAQNWPTRLAFFPTLHARAQGSSEGASLFDQRFNRRAEFVSDLNLFRFGADVSAIQSAGAQEEAATSNLEATTLNVEQEGITALVAVIRTSRELEIEKGILDGLEDSLKVAGERYRRGLLPEQEVSKVSVDLENERAKMTDLLILDTDARAKLAALLGTSEIDRSWPWLSRFESVTWLKETDPDLALRPDWRSASQRLTAAEKTATRELTLMLPSLDATAAYVAYDQHGLAPQWTGALTLSVPLFDRLTQFSSYRAQLKVEQIAETDLEQVRRTAMQEWSSSRIAFQAALSSARIREKTLKTSRKLYDDNLRRFQAGRLSANELSVDKNRLLNSELFAVQGWATAHEAYARLCHSVGKRVLNCEK